MIMEKLKVLIQCLDVDGKTGTFLKGIETGKQYTPAFASCAELFDSMQYKELKRKHEIIHFNKPL